MSHQQLCNAVAYLETKCNYLENRIEVLETIITNAFPQSVPQPPNQVDSTTINTQQAPSTGSIPILPAPYFNPPKNSTVVPSYLTQPESINNAQSLIHPLVDDSIIDNLFELSSSPTNNSGFNNLTYYEPPATLHHSPAKDTLESYSASRHLSSDSSSAPRAKTPRFSSGRGQPFSSAFSFSNSMDSE
jgi:hypothetical protein